MEFLLKKTKNKRSSASNVVMCVCVYTVCVHMCVHGQVSARATAVLLSNGVTISASALSPR